ncbi:MAG TPA: glycosyltransferase family 2 protein [Catalimonadaceae bacterium]|nr:glycosyltransferase family 2 protein [Catalimonadaceae bacterium]
MEGILAIVIPAFKPDFLEKALQSIENQNTKNFQVYIGDDGSPHNLWKIAEPFVNRNGWIYHRFETNEGGTNLVNHWNRCVALSHEPWIWLFSDDDEMSPDCVAAFHEKIQSSNSSVLKFNFSIIDEESNVLEMNQSEEKAISGFDFGRLRFERKILTSAVEFVFKRSAYDREAGFVNFPSAWCSDDASWIAFSEPEKIEKIDYGLVLWRMSKVNISSLAGSYIEAKTEAALQFICWFNNRYRNQLTGALFGEQVIWFRLQLEHLNFIVTFQKAVQITNRLRPSGFASWLRTFNEVYARSATIIQNKPGKKPTGIRAWLAFRLPKF